MTLTFSFLCTAAGLAVFPHAHSAHRMSNRARDGPTPPLLDEAADIELFAACLDSGLAIVTAAAIVATAITPAGSAPEVTNRWHTLARLLSLGVPADKAWASFEGPGAHELVQLARMHERRGVRIAEGCRRISARLRQDDNDAAVATAERAGVLIAAPLALCFLPAFMLLGLVPVVVGLGRTMFGL